MKKEIFDLPPEQQAEILALAGKSDEEIDFSDAAEQRDWRGATIGNFRPVKKQVSIRLDKDLLEFYQTVAGGSGYQTLINRVLRAYADTHAVKK